jgi:hypothetical protein
MQEPSAQLQRELKDAVQSTSTPARPILSHLNADTTWLLSLPYPEDAISPPQRSRFNILIDPWLQGPQSDVAGWFSTQWHKIKSSVQTIQELNDLLRDREDHKLRTKATAAREDSEGSNTSGSPAGNYIDAVICSHEFTDHCHRKTLEEIDFSVPCFATTKAAELIRSWKHFEQVFDVPAFGNDSDWRKTSTSLLPPWIGIARLVMEADALYYHSAIAIFCKHSQSKDPDSAEVVIYTPHGIHAEDLASIPTANPPVQTLVLMHGLHDVSITFIKQLNLGAHNALKCQTILKSKYWVGTHDEVKIGGGLLAPFLRRRTYTLDDALKALAKEREAADLPADGTNSFELGSGQTLVLS